MLVSLLRGSQYNDTDTVKRYSSERTKFINAQGANISSYLVKDVESTLKKHKVLSNLWEHDRVRIISPIRIYRYSFHRQRYTNHSSSTLNFTDNNDRRYICFNKAYRVLWIAASGRVASFARSPGEL